MLLAINTANTPARKAPKQANPLKIQYFGTFSRHLDRRFLLSGLRATARVAPTAVGGFRATARVAFTAVGGFRATARVAPTDSGSRM